MANEDAKILKARFKHKIDTAENWKKAGDNGFIPLDGEIIYYRDTKGADGRVYCKVGDGETNINDLPFDKSISRRTSGNCLRIDDISPISHEMDVKVRSRNLIPYPYAERTKTQAGVTWTDNGDGSITVTGTATGYSEFLFVKHMPIEKNTKYCFSISSKESYNNLLILAILFNKNSQTIVNFDDRGSQTPGKIIFDTGSYAEAVDVSLVIKRRTDGVATSGTVFPQFEIGDSASSYTPSNSLLNVSRYGKNLIDGSLRAKPKNVNGVVIKYLEDEDCYLLNGTQSGNIFIQHYPVSHNIFIDDYATVSIKYISGALSNEKDKYSQFCVFMNDTLNPSINTWTAGPNLSNSDFSFTVDKNKYLLKTVFFISPGAIFNNYKIRIQVEKGKNATEYIKSIPVSKYTPSYDGSVSGLTSLYPTTVISPDVDGAILDVEYNGDLSKVIENIETKIDTKLDKTTIVPSADSAYVEKKGGGQGLLTIISGNPEPESLVRRNGKGQIITADPTADNQAATKKYVDEHSSASPIKSISAGGKTLTPDANGNVSIPRGNDSTWGIVQTATADEIKYRNADSICITATYVDAVVKYALCYDRYASFEKVWTETEKESARTKLGVPSKEYVDGNIGGGAYFRGSVRLPGYGAGTGVKINNIWIPCPSYKNDEIRNKQGHTTDTGWDAGRDCDVDYNIKYSVSALQAKENAPSGSVQVTLNGTYYEYDMSLEDPYVAHTLDNQTYDAVYLDNETFKQTIDEQVSEQYNVFYYTLVDETATKKYIDEKIAASITNVLTTEV